MAGDDKDPWVEIMTKLEGQFKDFIIQQYFKVRFLRLLWLLFGKVCQFTGNQKWKLGTNSKGKGYSSKSIHR